MRKLWLTFTAMLLCSIASFAQTSLTQDNFVSAITANPSGSFILTEDINLGDLGELNASIIPTFSGTLNGKGKTITYQANFTGANNNVDYSLFGSVSGTIDSLNVNANVTLGGTINNMNIALICGSLTSDGVIEYCNVLGNVNSTVKPDAGGGSDAGLIVGQSAGTVRYCICSGNVVGVGYVGGLIGQMTNSASVLACSFTGNVTSNQPSNAFGAEYGSFAGGICGYVSNSSTLEFCHVDIIVNAVETDNGISSSKELVVQLPDWLGGGSYRDPQGTHTIRYSYASGEVGGDLVNGNNITNSEGTNSPNYYEGGDTPENIVFALNNAIPNDQKDKFYFDVINGEVVLIIGQRPTEEPDQPETPNYTYYRTIKQLGGFNESTTWEASVDGNDPWVKNVAPEGTTAHITINTGHRVTVNHDLKITEDYKIAVNNGVLQITQKGQLINTSNVNVPGIVEIVSAPKANQAWTFIGAPFQDNYVLGCILPESHDVSVKKYEYSEADWSDSWAHIGTPMNAGEGYFAFPFLDAPITFTTYGDVGTYEDRGNIGYTSTNTVTELNNTNVEVSLPSNCPNNWMALANPYPAKLSVSLFAEDNTNIQGQGIYRLKTSVVTNNDGEKVYTYDFVELVGDIAMTEGFFVNLASGNSVTFSKEQLTDYPRTQAKSQVAPREFVELSLVKGNYKSKLYFAHNQEAEQNYDIFDANKLFAIGEVAEPYFVTDGIALVKEEAKELPYYATMNVRSFANDTVSFVVNNIPEGLAVSIIDGENVIDMVEGGVYTTEILTGENADRFKVLIKKSVSISDVEELEVNITNNNRHINIETTETDLQVEVYNTLGQKVFSTKDRNFTLNQVSAGAYLIKAFNNKASKTQKIVVE